MPTVAGAMSTLSVNSLSVMTADCTVASDRLAARRVRAGVTCTSTEVNAEHHDRDAASTITTRRSRPADPRPGPRSAPPAGATARRPRAPAPTSATFATTSQPYVVVNSASTLPISISAWADAGQHQRADRVGGPARPHRHDRAEFGGVGPRQQEHDQHDQPAEPDAHRGDVDHVGDDRDHRHRRCARVARDRPGGHRRSCRARPAAPGRRPSPCPCTIGRSSTSAAPSTPSRIRCAAPYWLDSTSRTSEPRTLPRPPPATYGTCSASSSTVPSATRPAPRPDHPDRARAVQPRGHSSASISTAPTSSTSPT